MPGTSGAMTEVRGVVRTGAVRHHHRHRHRMAIAGRPVTPTGLPVGCPEEPVSFASLVATAVG